MGLCQGRSCGCAIASASLIVTGDGSAGNPWLIEGAAPKRISEAARAALTGPDLFEGAYVHTTDARRLWVYTNSAWEIEDEPWQTWTPTATQLGALTVTTNYAKYKRSRGRFEAKADINFTSAGTTANAIIASLPFTAVTRSIEGVFLYNRFGVANYAGTVIEQTTSSVILVVGDIGGTVGGLGASPSFAVASGHSLNYSMWGEY